MHFGHGHPGRTNYFEIGKNKSEDEFSRAFQDASRRKKGVLINGAVEAFRDGHPENLRVALSEPKTPVAKTADILQRITEGRDNKAAVIDSAFATTTEEFKKTVLDNVLENVICNGEPEVSFVAALLKSGADANAQHGVCAGMLLAYAVFRCLTPSIPKLLLDNGASVEGAIIWARQRRYSRTKGELEDMASKQLAVTNADLRETILQAREDVREEMQELRGEVKRLVALVEASGANKPEEKKTARTRILKS